MFCNVMMLLLLYVHICVTRTGWKTRLRPKTVILSIKQSIKAINQTLKRGCTIVHPLLGVVFNVIAAQ